MANTRQLAIEEREARWLVSYRDVTIAAEHNRSQVEAREMRPASAHDGGELKAAIVLALQTAGVSGLATQIDGLTVAATDGGTFTASQRRRGRVEYAQGGQITVHAQVTEADGSDRVTGDYGALVAADLQSALAAMVAAMGHSAFAAQIAGL